jgi:predicted membrane-bound spermidine synthase
MPLKHRILLALLVLGAYSQIVQAVLIREGLVVFYGNEVSLGVFYGSWLFWVAAGSAAVLRWRRWVARPLRSVRLLLLMLPFLLALQVLALRSVRLFLDVSSSEFVPLGELMLAFFLITIPSSLVLGLAFPLACKALRDEAAADGVQGAVGVVSRLYIADALGALIGGVVFTFVIIQWLGVVETLGLLTLALGLTAWSLDGLSVRRAWLALAVAALGVTLLVTRAGAALDARLEAVRFATLQPGLHLLGSLETRYGHLAIARLGKQISIVADGQIRESFPLPREVRQEAAYLYAQASGARRVLQLGGFASGLAAELLRYPVNRIDQVEEDRRAFDAVRPYLPATDRQALADPRLVMHFEDGRRFIQDLPKGVRYGLILVLNASPASAFSNRYFTRDFYRQVREHLTPEGVFCTRVSSASNYVGRAVAGYTGSVYHTLQSVFPQIAIAPGDTATFCAAAVPGRVSEEPVELERRYLATPLKEHQLSPAFFYTFLPAEEIAYLRERLKHAEADLNTDERPVTYYLNMVLWGKFSASGFVAWLEQLRAMGPWPYLLPLLLLVALWLLRSGLEGFRRSALTRRAATFVLAVQGMVAMATQLALLFSYQSHVGFMFERVALLNGLFMTGLALGAGVGQRWAAGGSAVRSLTWVMATVALVLLLMPGAVVVLAGLASGWQEPGYLALALVLGLITGTGFPLAVDLSHRDLGEILRSGGIAQAADNLGGALGGLITGALMVPILGVEGACRVLAAAAAIALVPLGFARLAPESIPGLRERGFQSFPWRRMGWSLTFVVLLVYGWQLAGREARPGPAVHFDEGRLAEVSGSDRFELREAPFSYYLGFTGASKHPDTASLSTWAGAPEVKGFAGPLNLLLSVDRKGLIRGVRYLDSDETPSYIAGIDGWLATLRGQDLTPGPLTLQRVDGMTGATVTSRAALEAINRSARRVSQAAFGRPVPAEGTASTHRFGADFWVTLALLLTFFPVYWSGSERARLLFQVASLVVLGLWLNTLVTEVDLVNLSLGHAASPRENPQRWLLLGFVGLTGILFGQVWCGYVCPFGAAQELVSRLGRRLGLRSYPERQLEQGLRYVKFLLLGVMLIAVWATGDTLWASFDPMQQAFGGQLSGWMLVLTLAVLLGSLAYVRFWCRYFCPMGAFLAFSNKLAFLQRLAPKRRLQHCDLGVRGEFDLDCIRCNRCLTGRDTHAGHREEPSPVTQSAGEAEERRRRREVKFN